MERTLAKVTIESELRFAKSNAERIARGAPPRERLLSEDPPVHDRDPVLTTIQNLVEDIETAGWMDFGFLIFRTHYSDSDLRTYSSVSMISSEPFLMRPMIPFRPSLVWSVSAIERLPSLFRMRTRWPTILLRMLHLTTC